MFPEKIAKFLLCPADGMSHSGVGGNIPFAGRRAPACVRSASEVNRRGAFSVSAPYLLHVSSV